MADALASLLSIRLYSVASALIRGGFRRLAIPIAAPSV